MLTVTTNNFHDKIGVGDDEIILNGPPGELRGQMSISNHYGETLRVRTIPINHDHKISALQSEMNDLHISCRLQPGEQRLEEIWLQVNPQTPPGIYESTLNIGNKPSRLKLVVQSNIEINIFPDHMAFQGVAPGQKHSTSLTLTNTGNVPFQIPDIKHIAALDMDYLCKALGMAMREKGAEGFTPMMDELTKNINRDLAGWASFKIKESGMIVEPGKTMLLHVTLTLPEDVDPQKDYSGNIRLWDKEITYNIKSHDAGPSLKKHHGK